MDLRTFLVGCCAVLLAPLVVGQASNDPRPLVLTGADVPDLLGAAVGTPVCYAYQDVAWQPCPLQIDERDLLDPGAAYPSDISDADDLFGGPAQLLYTAPQDYPQPGFTPVVPADTDPTFDSDDELVLMLRFFGEQVDPVVSPPPFSPLEVTELEVNGRFAYLYVPTSPLDQSGGIDLVDYQFDLLAGAFPDDYNFEGDGALRDIFGDFLGANPEYSAVETAYYKTSFEDRWIQRELFLADASTSEGQRVSYGPDLLDRVKFGGRPDRMGRDPNCSRSIYTGSTRRGTLGIQKDGPIRALRVVQGSNSGGLNLATYELYERYLVYSIAHQMHSTPGTTMFIDYSPMMAGMTYYSNQFPDGVAVDGVADRLAGEYYQNEYIEWDYLLGPQGSIVSGLAVETNIPDLFPYSYYEDNTTPEVEQCTGDTEAYASSGNVYFFGQTTGGNVPWTDPADLRSYDNGELRTLRMIRRVALDGITRTKQEADNLRTTLASTPTATSAVVESGGSIPVELTSFEAVRDGEAVVLRWATASETINAGFGVERSIDGRFEDVAFVRGAGTTSQAQAYAWRDTLLPFEAPLLQYRLRQVDFDGTVTYTQSVEVASVTPSSSRLLAPYPNPVAASAIIRYEVSRADDVVVEVYDVLGRRVAILAEGAHIEGRYQVDWVPSVRAGGTYLIRLTTDQGAQTQSIVVAQ
ncbi:MAG: T9SS type A sorting domain-containing protein [Bacteroidota bacterium]